MRLHVLGPAFGLPSIDADCLAAAALLQLCAPKGWHIVATHDQTRPLPFLVDGDEVAKGFKNIVKHVEKACAYGSPLNHTQQADSIAITSFIESHARTLLDILLYVSYENYKDTRSAFTKILPWYANYMIPPQRRADARMRTEHLGISSIDVDDVHEDVSSRPSGFDSGFDVGKEKTFEAETQKRASLLLPNRTTLRSLLQRPEHSAVFKLHTLADNFFEPLQGMLADGDYFLDAKEPHALDCLLYGYLSLMLFAELPQDWLANTMRRKYPKLVRFTERMHEKLKMQTDVADVTALAKCKDEADVRSLKESTSFNLPWEVPISPGLGIIAKSIAFDLAGRIPLVGPTKTELIPAVPRRQSFWQSKYFPAVLAATTTSIGLLGYYAFSSGLLVWPHGEAVHIFGRKRLADYGHIGAALAGISLLAPQATENVAFRPRDMADTPSRVEVEVEEGGVP